MKSVQILAVLLLNSIAYRFAAAFLVAQKSLAVPAEKLEERSQVVPCVKSANPELTASPIGDESMASAISTSSTDVEIKSETMCFGGRLLRCIHQSKSTKTPMIFSVFLPPGASGDAPAPVRPMLVGAFPSLRNQSYIFVAERHPGGLPIKLAVPPKTLILDRTEGIIAVIHEILIRILTPL